jgi:hypothetical protein
MAVLSLKRRDWKSEETLEKVTLSTEILNKIVNTLFETDGFKQIIGKYDAVTAEIGLEINLMVPYKENK